MKPPASSANSAYCSLGVTMTRARAAMRKSTLDVELAAFALGRPTTWRAFFAWLAMAAFTGSALAVCAAFAVGWLTLRITTRAALATAFLAMALVAVSALAFAGSRWRSGGWRRIRSTTLLAQHGLPGELDAIVIVNRDDFHSHLVTDLAHVFDAADELVVQLADVAQTVASWQDFDEGAEVFDRRHFALVYLADAHLFSESLDTSPGTLGTGGLGVGNVHGAVIFDVELGTGFLLNALDRLAARANQQADLLGIDANLQQPRRQAADLAT